MSAKILITHSYFLRFDPKQWRLQQPYPPLGTLYAAAILRQKRFDVAFHDVMFATSAESILPALEEHRPGIFVLCEDGFNYLSKMCLTNMREAAFRMIPLAKRAGCTVIVSGSDATDHSEEYLARGADYVVVGEPEITLQELVTALQEKKGVDAIHGLRFLENGILKQTPVRENLRELDNLPFPAWDLLDASSYRRRWMKSSGSFSLNLVTTRGCPYKCNWCAKPVYGNRYNSRSPENVVEELKLLHTLHGFDNIWFCDDIFGLKPGWVAQFAELIRQSGLKLKFRIQSRVDLLLNDGKHSGQVEALANAGCSEVWVGAESGSQKILDAMEKGTRVEQITDATRMLQKHGIRACFFLQFGYPGETREDIDATMAMVLQLMPDDLGISVSYPLPGTRFYETVRDQLKTKANWTDSDELAMMFRSTYPAEFYRKLQRYVHAEYRKRKALLAWQHKGDIRKGLSLAFRIPQTLASKAVIKKYVA